MLTPSYRQAYQTFLEALQEAQQTTSASAGGAIAPIVQNLQTLFKNQIFSLDGEELEGAVLSRWQSIQTELYKQMRLLETDAMLLQAARSTTTVATRRAYLSDRLKILVRYCDALLQPQAE